MRKLKTLNKTSNYKILSALPIIGMCLTTTQQTSSAMFRSAFSSLSRFVQRSTQSTINPSTPEVKYIYRNGSRIAITHSGSLKNSNLNQTSGISTTTSPSSSTNTLSRTSSTQTTTPTPIPSPNPSLSVRPKTFTSSILQSQSTSNETSNKNNNTTSSTTTLTTTPMPTPSPSSNLSVRPKTSTSSILQSQSANNTISNQDNKNTSSTAILNTTSTSIPSPNPNSTIIPKTSQSAQSTKTNNNRLNFWNGYVLLKILNDDKAKEELAKNLTNSLLSVALKHDYNIIKTISNSLK